jgi:hypothetical protein
MRGDFTEWRRSFAISERMDEPDVHNIEGILANNPAIIFEMGLDQGLGKRFVCSLGLSVNTRYFSSIVVFR